ncbi:MAG: acetate--CoA ligase family protein [Pseudomonadota bacterium]
MSASRLQRLFSPQSVAVLGGRVADSVVAEMQKLGFGGDIWPVNPNRADMAGIPCFKTLDDLPGVPDAVYLGIPGGAVVEVVEQLAKIGAGGVICHASGFSEVGDEGKARSKALIKAAGDMPVVGPNCWGVLNLMNRAAMWPDFHGAVPVESGVAIVNQSGNMAINYTMQQRGLSMAMLVTLGNQLMIDSNDCLEAFLDDERITAIGLHIEGINDLERFSKLAIRASELGKPIVALKTGSSEKGAHATVSHTATLAGSDKLYDALFKRHGIARVYSVPAFIETLKLMSIVGIPSGNRISTLSCSGGEASLLADRVEPRNLEFPDLTPEHTERVQATLNEYVDVTNPLDYHTFIWGDQPAMTATFGTMMEGGFDITALILDFPREDRSRVVEYHMAVDSWIDATKANNATTAIVATFPECMPENVALKLVSNGIVPFSGVEEFLDAFEAAQSTRNCSKQPIVISQGWPDNPTTLDEATSKKMLEEYGLTVAKSKLTTPYNAGADADELGYPVVMKATGIAHKTEAGGVKLNLRTKGDVHGAAVQLSKLSNELLIEQMIPTPTCELIVGVNRDPQFGLALIVGAGGILTELLQDSAPILLPTSRNQIDAALKSLKVDKLLQGYRGKTANREAVIDAIENVARFARDHASTLLELDINPIMVSDQATVADALIRIQN